MRKIATAFLFLLLLFHNSNSYAKNYSESKIVSETGDCNKNEPCLSIVIKSLKLDKTIKNNSKINEYIKNEALSMFEPEKIVSKEISEAVEKIKKEHKELYKEKDSAPILGMWSYMFNSELIYQSKDYVTIKIDQDTFTGGAHPNHYISYATFDLKTGKILKLKDLTKNLPLILQKGEKIFRDNNEMKLGKNLNDYGFWFENNKFRLTENFGITNSSIIFFYNNYDIAPYSMGSYEVVLDRKLFNKILP